MSPIDSFPTKRGVATFQDGVLVIEESFTDYVRSLYHNYWVSDVWWRKLMFVGFALWPLFVLGWLISVFQAGRFLFVVAILLITAVAWGWYYVRGFRSPDRIPLSHIECVASTRGQKGLTRPRITLTYSEEGATYRCRLNLPSLYTPDGDGAFEQAIESFKGRGFDVE